MNTTDKPSPKDCCDSHGDDDHFDIAVIGAGSAGFSAAITAADQGARVALIGYGTIGGTCVNVGCVPSKTMIRAAETIHQASASSRFTGLSGQVRINDWKGLIAQKQKLVDELRQVKYLDLLPKYETVNYIEGKAELAKGGVCVDGRLIKADKVILATGTRPAIPQIKGINEVPYLTSTSALELETQPESLLVIGGGYIGCELAQMFARTGTRVTLLTRSHLLPASEPEISSALSSFLADEGIRVIDNLDYEHIEKLSKGVSLTIRKDNALNAIEAEQVLITAGRLSNIEGLKLKEANVNLNSHGGVQVNRAMRSSNPDIYAAGDVTGHDQFVYMAAYGGKIAAKNALNNDGDDLLYDNSTMPAVVFTDPQLASVGLTEKQARDKGFNVRTSILGLEHVPRALAARDTRGLIKLVADADSKLLLGAHILAPEGADSIQTAAIAIAKEMTYEELANLIFPYLTTVEGLKLAAQTFEKDVSTLSCCAG